MIDVSKYTAHQRPGKFELESPATEYFYEQMCNGDGELVFADDCTDATCGTLFEVSAEEAEAFDYECGAWFLLREDSQGFAIGSIHATRDEAEKKFNQWIGGN